MRALAALLLAAALPAAAQTHIAQPFKFLWDYASLADRFEFKLDAGGYVNVGVPPQIGASFAIQADPTLTGAHSAAVRACLLAVCTPDSGPVDFVVDLGPPSALRLAVGAPPPVPLPAPPPTTESPNLTKVTAPAIGSIVDLQLTVWTLGPKDPAVEGGVEFVIVRNGVSLDGAATYLCYFNHTLVARSTGLWFQWDGQTFLDMGLVIPAGC